MNYRSLFTFAYVLFLALAPMLRSEEKPPPGPGIPQENIPKDIPPEVAEQIRLLYDKSRRVQGKALFALIEMEEKATPAIPFVLYLCKETKNVGQYASRADRVQIRDPEGKDTTRHEIAQRMINRFGKTSPELLIPTLANDQSPHLVVVLRALTGCSRMDAAEHFLKLMSHPDTEVRFEAIKSAGPLFGQKAHSEMTQTLTKMATLDQNPRVRAATAKAILTPPFKTGDPREKLFLNILREEPDEAVRSAAVNTVTGEISKKLFLAVLDLLDKDCCGGIDCSLFLMNTVKGMGTTMDELLASKDEAQRQKAYLLLYYYDPNLPDKYIGQLFADSADMRLTVIKHIIQTDQIWSQKAGLGLKLHIGGKYAIKRDGTKTIYALRKREKTPAFSLLLRHALQSDNMEIISLLLTTNWTGFRLDEDLTTKVVGILKTMQPADKRLIALGNIRHMQLTVEHYLDLLEIKDPKALQSIWEKLPYKIRDSDERLKLGYQEWLKKRQEFSEPKLYQDLLVKRAKEKTPVPDIPRLIEPEILEETKKYMEKNPRLRRLGTQSMRTIKKVILHKIIKKAIEDKNIELTTEALFHDWHEDDTNLFREPTVPAEAAPLLIEALQSVHPQVSDHAAFILASWNHHSATPQLISYIAYHIPWKVGLDRVAKLGVPAVEPLTALVLSHGNKDWRQRAMQALGKTITQDGDVGDAVRQARITQQALVKIMLNAPDDSSRAKAIMYYSPRVLSEKTQRAVFTKLKKEGNSTINHAINNLKPPPIERKRPTPPPLAHSTSWEKGPEVSKLLGSNRPEDQICGLEKLARVQKDKVSCTDEVSLFALVRPLAKSDNAQVRLGAVRALARFPRGRNLDVLTQLTQDKNRAVAHAATAQVRLR